MTKPFFIAEVKIHSPFGFDSDFSFEELADIAIQHGDAVAVHTENRWLGDPENITYVRERTDKMVIAKGIHHTDGEVQQCLDLGANMVWVVGRMPEKPFIPKCIIEPYDINQLRMIPRELHSWVVWNRRNLEDGGFRDQWNWARQEFLFQTLGCASFIEHPKDVPRNADFFVVGQHLPEFVKEWHD